MGRPTVIVLNRWGVTLRLPARVRGSGRILYLAGEQYEPELVHLDKLLKTGHTMIDVGANIGVYTIVGSTLVGEHGRVISIEPATQAYADLIENVQLNGFQNIIPLNLAIADFDGEAKLRVCADTSRNALGSDAADSDYEKVKVARLDQLVQDHQVSQVDLIKLDIEGAEELALRGAMDLLHRFRPILIMEANNSLQHSHKVSVGGVLNILTELGYSFFVVSNNELVNLESMPLGGNIIARPIDSHS